MGHDSIMAMVGHDRGGSQCHLVLLSAGRV